MQIDGHHAVTYVAARSAGFNHDEAEIISYAAQYVDDATNEGIIQFGTSQYMYSRIASAHKMIDYTNFIQLQNHLAWLPFHFLPGNGGFPFGQEPDGGETAKLVCKPDSHVARDMLRAALQDKPNDRGLHRLGIAMHVYADTFAHQGFVGALCKLNRASNLRSNNSVLDEKIKNTTLWEMIHAGVSNISCTFQLLWKSLVYMIKERKSPGKFWSDFLNQSPLGHAAANTYPDQPYLVWEYLDWDNQPVRRDNPATFMLATNMMVKAMRAWRAGDNTMSLDVYEGLSAEDTKIADTLFRTIQDPDGDTRHASWLTAIESGEFSFGAAKLAYIGKGAGSWKDIALGTLKEKDSGVELFDYTPAFLSSNWKLFHDAIQAHRISVVHDILPRYGVCAA